MVPTQPERMACKLCGVPGVTFPMGAAVVATLVCAACGKQQRANDYMSPADQLRRAAAAAIGNRASLERMRTQGVQCKTCGAGIELPEDITVPTFRCRFCATDQLVSNYVAPELMMGVGIRARMDEIRNEGRRRDRTIGIVVGIGIAIVVIVAGLLGVLGRLG